MISKKELANSEKFCIYTFDSEEVDTYKQRFDADKKQRNLPKLCFRLSGCQ